MRLRAFRAFPTFACITCVHPVATYFILHHVRSSDSSSSRGHSCFHHSSSLVLGSGGPHFRRTRYPVESSARSSWEGMAMPCTIRPPPSSRVVANGIQGSTTEPRYRTGHGAPRNRSVVGTKPEDALSVAMYAGRNAARLTRGDSDDVNGRAGVEKLRAPVLTAYHLRPLRSRIRLSRAEGGRRSFQHAENLLCWPHPVSVTR